MFSSYFLSVSPAVTWLTVYRRLQVRIGRAWTRGDYRTIGEFGADFLKKLSLFYISNQVLDFSGLKHDIADLYARGFASL